MPRGLRGDSTEAFETLVAPKDETKPIAMSISLKAFRLPIEDAERLADALEGEPDFRLWMLYAPSPGERARFVERLRKGATRARQEERDRAQRRAEREAKEGK